MADANGTYIMKTAPKTLSQPPDCEFTRDIQWTDKNSPYPGNYDWNKAV